MARIKRGEEITHWCYLCVSSVSASRDGITGRIRVPVIEVLSASSGRSNKITLARVELVGIGRPLAEYLASDPTLIYGLSPSQFEEFVCEQLHRMGFEPQRVGNIFQRDGGVDIIFRSREPAILPILGAAQVKHHHHPAIKEGVSSVRDLAGTIAGHPFNIGLFVTNTSFTPDAEWFVRERAKLLRLRGFTDIKRWLSENFSDNEEWREFPETIELCPGVTIRVRPGFQSDLRTPLI